MCRINYALFSDLERTLVLRAPGSCPLCPLWYYLQACGRGSPGTDALWPEIGHGHDRMSTFCEIRHKSTGVRRCLHDAPRR
jgi:hypothetical protein